MAFIVDGSTGCPKKSVPFLVSLTDKGTLFLGHPVGQDQQQHPTVLSGGVSWVPFHSPSAHLPLRFRSPWKLGNSNWKLGNSENPEILPFFFGFNRFQPFSTVFMYFELFSTIVSRFQPFSAVFNQFQLFQPFSAVFICFQLFSAGFNQFQQLSTIFRYYRHTPRYSVSPKCGIFMQHI